MTDLRIQVLGEFSVLRDGACVALPRSRKTRALLAYLALNPGEHRREQLCELFWSLPDDPRGSLRWSLSKLRRLVNDPDAQRIAGDPAAAVSWLQALAALEPFDPDVHRRLIAGLAAARTPSARRV